jgi:small-conductance mechanosensitive channel
MRDSTEDAAKSAEQCMSEQREFFSLVSKALVVAAKVTEVENRMSAEMRELRTQIDTTNKNFSELQEGLKPVLEAYKKGMSIKSRLGNLALGYVVAIILFPQLAPTSILSVLKLLF